MAAGVGKTYRMLGEAHEDVVAGVDVCVGVLETHGRGETEAQAHGLEILPRREVVHRGSTLFEMDLPGILDRRPERCLIDELAHTNAPGLEHAKRYEDVEEILVAGIDVRSTVNIQHLESLNDQIAELSGVTVRETIPDRVLADADEVVIVDVTPETLLARLRDGKVYPAERIEPALNGFFKIENLTALREIALRQIAEEVAPKRAGLDPCRAGSGGGGRGGRVAEDAPRAVGERLLALVRPEPDAHRLVRRAWRSAQRLGAELDLLWVRRPGTSPTEESERQLSSLRRLTSVLGVHLLIEEDDDVAQATVRVATQLGTTYIVLGAPAPLRGLRRLREPLPQKLMRLLPTVDVRIVGDRARRPPPEPS
jgi:two-component system, OmpR family, sensor histidine kinase KdpD